MEKNLFTLNVQITHKYDDIINMEYPRPDRDVIKHPPMAIGDRAKIFAPFAALKGYEELIQEKQKQHAAKKDLSDEVRDYLDRRLNKLP